MKIFYDENMPFAKEFFNEFDGKENDLVAFKGRELNAEQESPMLMCSWFAL